MSYTVLRNKNDTRVVLVSFPSWNGVNIYPYMTMLYMMVKKERHPCRSEVPRYPCSTSLGGTAFIWQVKIDPLYGTFKNQNDPGVVLKFDFPVVQPMSVGGVLASIFRCPCTVCPQTDHPIPKRVSQHWTPKRPGCRFFHTFLRKQGSIWSAQRPQKWAFLAKQPLRELLQMGQNKRHYMDPNLPVKNKDPKEQHAPKKSAV